MNKEVIYKFIQKYFFIYKAAADGWRIKYHTRNKISFYNNINSISKSLLNNKNFIKYYSNTNTKTDINTYNNCNIKPSLFV